MNVADSILFHCRYDPEAPAICIPGVDLISYGRLEKAINNVIRHAMVAGLLPGHMVAVHIPEKLALHAILVLAFAKMGVITASVGSRPLPQSFQFDAIVSDGPHPHTGLQTIAVDFSWVEGDGTPPGNTYIPQGKEICRIVLTSGTTGEPKGVALTHDMILGRIMRYYSIFGSIMPSCSRIFCDTLLTTSIGFTFFVYTLCKGGTFFARGLNAEVTLRSFRLNRVQAMISAPAGLAEFVGHYETHHCRHLFETIVTTGSALSPTLVDNVRGRLGVNIISGYGSTEAGQIATAPADVIAGMKGAVGYINPGMMVEIVDENNQSLPQSQEGSVRVRGAYMANLYIGEARDDAQYFKEGWFYPGDVGSLSKDGMLSIAGRQKSVLNLGGEKVRPEYIEEILALFGGGLQAGAFLVPNPLGIEEIWAALESPASIDEGGLTTYCRKKLPDMFVPKQFIRMPKLPRNEMGKLDRQALVEIGRKYARG